MDTPTPPKTKSFSHQAAKLSWICPIIVCVLAKFDGHVSARLAILTLGLIEFSFLAVGLIFGVVALFGIPKHGTKSILWPAIIGIIINGLLLLIFVTNFMAARARAMQQNSEIKAPQVIAVWSDASHS